MILSFINIRKVPRKGLENLGLRPRFSTSPFARGFQHLPRDLSNVNELKIMFDPYIEKVVLRNDEVGSDHNLSDSLFLPSPRDPYD